MLALTSPVIWYTSRATGIVALVLLSTTVALGLRTAGRRRTPRWPGFATAELHKRLSVITLVFLGLHILTGVADTFVHLGWPSIIVPFASTYKPFWTGLGTVAFDLLVAVAISSALRQRIPPHIWRGLHWLAYVCWPIAVAHAIGIGTDTKHGWEDLILGLCVAAVVYAAGWRLVEGALARRAAQRSGALTRAPARASSVTPTGRRPSSVPPVRRPVASSSRRP